MDRHVNSVSSLPFCVKVTEITGCFLPSRHRDPTPSFALMDIQGPVVVTYVYSLVDGEVRVGKVEYRKSAEPPKVAAVNSTQGQVRIAGP